MKILFRKEGKRVWLADKERLIFCVDGHYYDRDGNETRWEEPYREEEGWYQYWMEDEGLDAPLKAVSTVEPVCEIDDIFGCFGFQNEAGEFVIEPQYAFAHDFTNGLAAVNLNRTWYRGEKGERYYENHFGYIDGKGKTVIAFQYDEAEPFNKYGVAAVAERGSGSWLIDKEGKEIPGTRFSLISHYDYDNRFLEFDYADGDGETVGIYDTKERKILLEPSVETIIEWDEDCILVYRPTRSGSDFRQYYINSRGEILYPWLYGKGFSIVERPDVHRVAAVAVTQAARLKYPVGDFFRNGDRHYCYGLYSEKEKFLLPLEYEDIQQLGDDTWACCKDGIITVVQTEESDRK